MVELRSYCEPGVSMQPVWIDGGFTPCFFLTLVPAILGTLAVLLGTLHCVCYTRFGASMEPRFVPRSRLYKLQLALSGLLGVQALVWTVFRVAWDTPVAGYVVLCGCLYALAWAWATALLRLERKRVLVRDRTRGHSAVLLVYWTAAFICENLAFVSWESPRWWWGLENPEQTVSTGEMSRQRIQVFSLVSWFQGSVRIDGYGSKPQRSGSASYLFVYFFKITESLCVQSRI